MLVDSTWNAKPRGEVNGDVAGSLVELHKTFCCAAKKQARKKYANCDFCQMDHNLVLMRAATARITRTLPIQADGLFERERVYSSYRRCWWYHCEVYSHSSLGKKSIGSYEMEMHFSNLKSTRHKHKKAMMRIQIDIEWVNKYGAD